MNVTCREQYGRENVILSDIVKAPTNVYLDGTCAVVLYVFMASLAFYGVHLCSVFAEPYGHKFPTNMARRPSLSNECLTTWFRTTRFTWRVYSTQLITLSAS